MPFDKDTKARMFTRCARICCLCFKQCGTNIEAAHIMAEGKGGPNTEDNGIPVCMDCHTEISHYNDKEPKGNKFTPQELKARRDQVYAFVESGALHAQIIAARAHGMLIPGAVASPDALEKVEPQVPERTKEAAQMLEAAHKGFTSAVALPRKLLLLGEQDQAFVLDGLLEDFETGESLAALVAIVVSGVLGSERTLVLTEQVLRKVTLATDPTVKSRFMDLMPADLLKTTDEGLRHAFFEEIIVVMKADKYDTVNKITPSVPRVQRAIPQSLLGKYLEALIDQAGSDAFQGKPAAARALEELPEDIARPALEAATIDWVREDARGPLATLLARTRGVWPPARQQLFEDFLQMRWYDFYDKYQGR